MGLERATRKAAAGGTDMTQAVAQPTGTESRWPRDTLCACRGFRGQQKKRLVCADSAA